MRIKIIIFIATIILGIYHASIPLNGQFSYPISVNGHIDLNFSFKLHETLGNINTYRFRIDPSSLIYFNPYIEGDRYKYALGIRTSFIMNYYQDDTWKQHWNYIGIYPVVRYYFKFGTFIEVNGGPRIFLLRRKNTDPSSLLAVMHGRYLIWDAGLGIGHSFKIGNKISFEPLITYNIANVCQKCSQPPGYIPHDEAKSGFVFLVGFQFMIYQP